mmetsp:Transcript_69108/g.202355  ORF Transcript_69108/g.202355 Transcript_69108/m.202355 type:complete len:225 (+) Transcript_69108:31-705(+)
MSCFVRASRVQGSLLCSCCHSLIAAWAYRKMCGLWPLPLPRTTTAARPEATCPLRTIRTPVKISRSSPASASRRRAWTSAARSAGSCTGNVTPRSSNRLHWTRLASKMCASRVSSSSTSSSVPPHRAQKPLSHSTIRSSTSLSSSGRPAHSAAMLLAARATRAKRRTASASPALLRKCEAHAQKVTTQDWSILCTADSSTSCLSKTSRGRESMSRATQPGCANK